MRKNQKGQKRKCREGATFFNFFIGAQNDSARDKRREKGESGG